MGSGDWRYIIVNYWKFCQSHGQEKCDQCKCDYRLENNHAHDLYKILDELLLQRNFDLDKRMSRRVYNRGAIPVSPGSKVHKCRTHSQKDCWSCFDWIGLVKREVGLLYPDYDVKYATTKK